MALSVCTSDWIVVVHDTGDWYVVPSDAPIRVYVRRTASGALVMAVHARAVPRSRKEKER